MKYFKSTPVLIQEGCTEFTTDNTAFIVESAEADPFFLKDPKTETFAEFNGETVIIDKKTGVIKYGRFKGKKVNLVKGKKTAIKRLYKLHDMRNDLGLNARMSEKDLAKTALASKKFWEQKQKDLDYRLNFWGGDEYTDQKQREIDDHLSKDYKKGMAQAMRELNKVHDAKKRREILQMIRKGL